MPQLDTNFNELRERIRQGRAFHHAGFEPVYYLVFKPTQIIEVKRTTAAWKARLQNSGFAVHIFSMADTILDICRNAPLRKLWVDGDSRQPTQWQNTNDALANAITRGALTNRLGDKLDELASHDNPILIITDLEALHPYTRIGAIESQLHGRFHTPSIMMYPGVRTGESRLRFLGFYPEDGNYRSVHVGG